MFDRTPSYGIVVWLSNYYNNTSSFKLIFLSLANLIYSYFRIVVAFILRRVTLVPSFLFRKGVYSYLPYTNVTPISIRSSFPYRILLLLYNNIIKLLLRRVRNDIVLLTPSLYVLIALLVYINIRETEFIFLSFISISNPRVTTLVVVYTNIS